MHVIQTGLHSDQHRVETQQSRRASALKKYDNRARSDFERSRTLIIKVIDFERSRTLIIKVILSVLAL